MKDVFVCKVVFFVARDIAIVSVLVFIGVIKDVVDFLVVSFVVCMSENVVGWSVFFIVDVVVEDMLLSLEVIILVWVMVKVGNWFVAFTDIWVTKDVVSGLEVMAGVVSIGFWVIIDVLDSSIVSISVIDSKKTIKLSKMSSAY